MTDTTPLKGIPSRVPTSGFRSPTLGGGLKRPNLSRTPAGRKEGGVKLLDFTEQPLGIPAKRRKKMEAEEAHKKAAEAAALAAAAAAASSQNAATATAPVSSATPDYAAGLTASAIYTQPATPAPTPIGSTKAGVDNGGGTAFGGNKAPGQKASNNNNEMSPDHDMGERLVIIVLLMPCPYFIHLGRQFKWTSSFPFFL